MGTDLLRIMQAIMMLRLWLPPFGIRVPCVSLRSAHLA